MALHAVLEDDVDALLTCDPAVIAELSDDLYADRVCEEFPGLDPARALALPMRRVTGVLDVRAYRRAWEQIQRADEEHPPERTLWFHLVMDTVEAWAEEERRWRAESSASSPSS